MRPSSPRRANGEAARLPRCAAWAAAFALVWLTGSLAPPSAAAAGLPTWHAEAGLRWREVAVPAQGKPGFTLLDGAATGVRFTNVLAETRWLTNSMLLNGSGLAAGDVDGDDWPDLYFCGLDGPNALYRNLGGWRFEDITDTAGVACPGLDATGTALADLDGDGDLDLVVNSLAGGTHLFFNDGHGRFTRQSAAPPLNAGAGGTSLALADLDGDGDLDLYLANYRAWSIRDRPGLKISVADVGGRPVVTAIDGRPATEPDLVGRLKVDPQCGYAEGGEADLLLLNDGQGRFTPVPFPGGAFLDEAGRPLAAPPYDWGLSVLMRDFNGDGLPDIYVCNDFDSPDRVWLNLGGGRFRAQPRQALRNTSIFSMGGDVADIDRDGHDDLFTVDMLSPIHQRRLTQSGTLRLHFLGVGQFEDRPQYSRNSLFRNRGDGSFAEISCYAGVAASEWSWGAAFLDVDLDGFEDLIIATGNELDSMNADVTRHTENNRIAHQLTPLEHLQQRKLYGRLALPKGAWRNRGDWSFADTGAAWGFTTPSVTHGLAFADLDNDGDLDLVMNDLNGPAALYRNDTPAPRLAVRLRGRAPNTRGIGARLRVLGGAVPMQSQEIIAGGRYLSSDDPMRVFAAGPPTNRMRVEVTWRSGQRTLVAAALPNRLYEIAEPAPATAAIAGATTPAGTPWFQDVSHLLQHTHHEEPFDDFERQPLLPRKLSQLGPGVAWHDLDGDGWEDLIIGSGKGGRMAVFRNDGQGGFQPWNGPPLDRVVGRDQTTILGFGATLLAGSSNYEDGLTNGGCIRIYDLRNKATGESILGQLSARGPLALGDMDGDGDLDLFIGGRCVPGRYPEPATSLLMRNEEGKFAVAQTWGGAGSLGLVSGAVFSDLDGDGMPELVLACEWGPIRVWRRANGLYAEITQQVGLDRYRGWWNGVTTGDLDSDGRLDILGANWGLNNRFRPSPSAPRRVYFGDLEQRGMVDVVEARFDAARAAYVPDQSLPRVSGALPGILEKTPSFAAYAAATVADLYGDHLKAAAVLDVNTLASMLFLNRGARFEPRELPPEAQLTPAFGVCVGDADGDGHEDVFLSQNFFATQPDAWRHDAGRGLWLRGDGQGGLTPVPGQQSGVLVYGEQRGCALADYDGDGRVDLVVTQNGAPTRLYHNTGAQSGLRVRLVGAPGNQGAVGATLRLGFNAAPAGSAPAQGPAREIHAGSGYWSQDGAIQVMATPRPPTQVWVRWPGGKTATYEVPPGARQVTFTQ